MNYNKKIPLEQDKIHLLIKSFEDGEFMYYEKFREHPTITQNGKGAAIWNEIHTQISKNFTSDVFQIGQISRGLWSLVYLYDKRTKYLYTFMRDENFRSLHKKGIDDQLFHYSNVLSRLNAELLGTYEPLYEQLSFIKTFNLKGDIDTKLAALLETMINTVEGDIERYAIILVNTNRGNVKEIKCIIPIAYAEPMYIEDWTEYISAEYNTDDYEVDETIPTEDEIVLYENDEDIELSIISEIEEQTN